MAISLQNLEYFCTCAECGSFRTAADKLFRSYQSVYQGVHQLEADLGSPLFLTENGILVLTDFGRYTLTHYVTPLLNDLHQLNNSLDTYTRDKDATLRVEIDQHFPKWLTAAQQAADILQKRHPQALISCKAQNPVNILEHLHENAIELGMRHSTPQSSDLSKALNTRSELYLLAAPTHRLAKQSSVSVEDVRTEALLFHNPNTCSKMSIWDLTGLSRRQAVVIAPEHPLAAELFNQGKLLRPLPLP